jgi:fibronectin type 3 domain-containing protein
VSGSQISLSWSASTDNVGVVGYRVYRSQTSGEPKTLLTATPVAGLMYTDSGLASGTTYFYVVKAIDAESNQSAASPEASATTADTVPPAAPGNVKGRPL